MASVPARVAGVERIAVVTPKASEATLAAAHALGIDEVYSIGGAQAVAALAFGTETIAPVDKIVGPGNRWVTAAKLLVSSHVAIDLPAGPSEVVLIADASADPARCAADLLAQAEHGPDSEAILLSLDRELAESVRRLVAGMDNVSIRDVPSLDEAVALSEVHAPEHLELWVADADAVLGRIRNAGTIFVRTSAVVGDYAAGATHVLPQGASHAARAGSGSRRSSSRSRWSAVPSSHVRGRSGFHSRGSRGSPCTRLLWSWREGATAPGGLSRLRVVAVLGGRGIAARTPSGTDPPLRPEHTALSGGASGAARPELRALERVSGRDVRGVARGAAAYCGVSSEQVVIGAGADELILLCARTFLGPASSAAIEEPTYGLYRIATELEERRTRPWPTAST